MNTTELKKFAQTARRQLIEQVEARLDLVLQTDSAELREQEKAIKQLRDEIDKSSREAVVERVAYLWFNRFCALRFMDVNRYTRIGTISPAEGFSQPEILQDAKQGYIDDELQVDRKKVFDLLGGQAVSADPQQEAYRLLLVAVCNSYHKLMPFMFQRISDYSELLMPDDLLSENSVLASIRKAIRKEVVSCQLSVVSGKNGGKAATDNCTLKTDNSAAGGVEVIGWLYQFYISEKKDQVFAGLKKNKKITPENIPAATQLFTPHWIVRYLVENSLGRLWMLNHPDSQLVDRMEYYIRPDTQVVSCQSSVVSEKNGGQAATDNCKLHTENSAEGGTDNCTLKTDNLRISSPEEIRICDPACGSGHMLTYAFDLLYLIYEEQGYDTSKIPQLILTNNLYGIEIDERAGELAAFALMMKARQYDRRFFRRKVMPNICVLENIELSSPSGQLSVVSDQLMEKLLHDLHLFREADNFGSLLRPQLSAAEIADIRDQLTEHWKLNTDNSLFDAPLRQSILKALDQAEYLIRRYHVVIANPPYMGGKGMNGRLKTFLKEEYTDVKSDLFSAFIVRNTELTLAGGQLGFMTPFVWMFISSYEKLRNFLIDEKTITSLVQLEYSGFDGATVPICAFTLENLHKPYFRGGYIRLSDFKGAAAQGPKCLEIIKAANRAGK